MRGSVATNEWASSAKGTAPTMTSKATPCRMTASRSFGL